MRYYLEIRSQHAKRGRSGFSGPDTYVAVQCVPEGVTPLKYLNWRVGEKRGITIRYFGEGYKAYQGSRSSLGQAIQRAKDYIKEMEEMNQ